MNILLIEDLVFFGSVLAVAVLFFNVGLCLTVQIFSVINLSYRTDLSQIIANLARILNPSQNSGRVHILSFILLTINVIYFTLC